MPYQFAVQNLDYSDFSAGRVLYSLPGLPAFPVRLASEIFQRAVRRLQPSPRGLSIYDPTCGGAYHLVALGFIHADQIHSLTASDADNQALGLARRNLSLLEPHGLARRETEIRQMIVDYGKESHAAALTSLQTLRQLRQGQSEIATRVFSANALDPAALSNGLQNESVDLVISDVPYGQLSGWREDQPSEAHEPPLRRMLAALLGVLTPRTLVAIAADKGQKIDHPAYQRVEHFQIGKRQVVFLQPTA